MPLGVLEMRAGCPGVVAVRTVAFFGRYIERLLKQSRLQLRGSPKRSLYPTLKSYRANCSLMLFGRHSSLAVMTN
jgi:hypothetical protein